VSITILYKTFEALQAWFEREQNFRYEDEYHIRSTSTFPVPLVHSPSPTFVTLSLIFSTVCLCLLAPSPSFFIPALTLHTPRTSSNVDSCHIVPHLIPAYLSLPSFHGRGASEVGDVHVGSVVSLLPWSRDLRVGYGRCHLGVSACDRSSASVDLLMVPDRWGKVFAGRFVDGKLSWIIPLDLGGW
jgi:hypothetical protein